MSSGNCAIDVQQFHDDLLLQPELLPESVLRQYLQNSCIEIPKFKEMTKLDLVEMFVRIVMPRPQRQHDKERNFGRKLSEVRATRNIPIENEEHKYGVKRTLCLTENKSSPNAKVAMNNHNLNERNKDCRRTDMSSDSNRRNNEWNSSKSQMKRKSGHEEQNSPVANFNKRQKITWP